VEEEEGLRKKNEQGRGNIGEENEEEEGLRKKRVEEEELLGNYRNIEDTKE
jgi:hypothetical protein